MTKREKRCMELLNLNFEELQALKMQARLYAVRKGIGVFVDRRG